MTSLYLNTKNAILEIVFKEYKRDEKVMELGFRKWEHQLPFDTEEDLSGLPTPLVQRPRFGKKNLEEGARRAKISNFYYY